MTRWISTAAILAVTATAIHAATPGAMQAQVRVNTYLTVDGAPCGAVKQWQGGDMRLAARSDVTVGPDTFKTATGEAFCAPVSFEIQLPAPEPVMALIRDMCDGGTRTATLVLSDTPIGTTAPTHVLEISGAFITEIRFKAISIASKDLLAATLVFQGTSSRTIDALPAAAMAGPRMRHANCNNFRLQIPKVDASRVSRIEAFTILRPTNSNSLGANRGSAAYTPGRPVFPHLLGQVAFSDSGDLLRWRDEAIASRSPLMRDSTLTLLDPAGAEVLVFHFTGLGMVGVGVTPTDASSTRIMQVEFSCERIAITVPAATQPGAAAQRSA